MAQTLTQRMMELGVPFVMANELVKQINSGVYNWQRLMNAGWVTELAQYLAKSLATGTFVPTKAVEYSMSPAVATLVKREGGGGLNALSPMKKKLADESADMNWVTNSDSTGNAKDEFIYLIFVWLGFVNPRWTLQYVPPDGAGGYGPPETVQVGSGPRTFRLYNNATPGKNLQFIMGDKYDGAFIAPGRTWDLFWLNHGKNHVVGTPAGQVQGEFMAAIAQTQLDFPNAQYLITDQYPNLLDNNMALADACWRDLQSNAPALTLLNLYNPPGVTYVTADYVDDGLGVHLTGAANVAKVVPVFQALWNSSAVGNWTPEPVWLAQTALNLLDGDLANQRYADYSQDGDGTVPGAANVVPAGHSTVGTITYAKEAVITYRGAPRSQKITAVSGSSYMGRNATSTKRILAGGNYVVMTAIKYIASGSASTVGRNVLAISGGATPLTLTSRNLAEAQGGWRIECFGPVLVGVDAGGLSARQFADSAATPDTTHASYVQSMQITIGKLPRIGA